MADLDQVRAAVAEGIAARDALADQIRGSGSDLATARRERDRLRTTGADEDAIRAADAQSPGLAATAHFSSAETDQL